MMLIFIYCRDIGLIFCRLSFVMNVRLQTICKLRFRIYSSSNYSDGLLGLNNIYFPNSYMSYIHIHIIKKKSEINSMAA